MVNDTKPFETKQKFQKCLSPRIDCMDLELLARDQKWADMNKTEQAIQAHIACFEKFFKVLKKLARFCENSWKIGFKLNAFEKRCEEMNTKEF